MPLTTNSAPNEHINRSNVRVTSRTSSVKQLLVNALGDTRNNKFCLFTVASTLFEQLNQTELFVDTDPESGEYYIFKCSEFQLAYSLKLHPKVASWLGWHSQCGASKEGTMESIMEIAYNGKRSNTEIAIFLNEYWPSYSTVH